jgi:hypothetical protein
MSKRAAPKKAAPSTLEIRLKRFQPAKMQTNRACIMLGKKGTGKSTLIEDIMWYQQNIPVGCIMSATEEANENFSRMAPPLFIYKNFDAEGLEKLINRQKKMKKMYKKNGDYLPFDHRAFVILDDCMYEKKNFRGTLMRELFMNGRHWDLFVLITIQYIMDMTPEIRSNTDYVFTLKDNIVKNRERLYQEYFGLLGNFSVFDALFLEVTQDFRCLVLDNTVPSTKVEDVVFWYKAEKRPPYRLGAEWYWKYSAANVKTNEDVEEQKLLEEMNQKSVRVVMEGQKPPPQVQPQKIHPLERPMDRPPMERNNSMQRMESESSIHFGHVSQRQQYDGQFNDSRYDGQDQRQYQGQRQYEGQRQYQATNYSDNYATNYSDNYYQPQERPAPQRRPYNVEWDYGNGYPGYRPRKQHQTYAPHSDVRNNPQFNASVFYDSQMPQATYAYDMNQRIQPVRAGYNRPNNPYSPKRYGGFV